MERAVLAGITHCGLASGEVCVSSMFTACFRTNALFYSEGLVVASFSSHRAQVTSGFF